MVVLVGTVGGGPVGLGQKVLRLNFRAGEIQFNGASGGYGRMTINNNAVRVYDANNILRVQIGEL